MEFCIKSNSNSSFLEADICGMIMYHDLLENRNLITDHKVRCTSMIY